VQNVRTDFQLILPAAGFARRLGGPKAKELLLNEQGEPLINAWLNWAASQNIPVHVITRQEKTELIEHLKEWRQKMAAPLSVQIIEPTIEWPETLLQSQVYWAQNIIVGLPDSILHPLSVLSAALTRLTQEARLELIYGVLENAPDLEKMGGICDSNTKAPGTELKIFEKPFGNELEEEKFQAWTFMAFKKDRGEQILQTHLRSTLERVPLAIKINWLKMPVVSYIDATRSREEIIKLNAKNKLYL